MAQKITLIVARKDENDIFIVGDSRLSDMEDSPLTRLEGTLKVLVINSNCCVAFAGTINEELTGKYQRIINKKVDFSNEELLDELLNLHNECNQAIDFIVALLKPHTNIYQIKDGALTGDLHSSWIGDIGAFKKYQRYFLSNGREREIKDAERYNIWIIKCPDHPYVNQELFSLMCKSMREVIHNPSIKEVGDYLLPVSTTETGFNYMHYLDIDVPLQQLREGWNTVPFGSAEEDGHAIVVLTPINSGIQSVGVHFFQWRFGAFFSPKHSFFPILVRGVNRNEFADEIGKKYGIELYGPELH